jgi:hypothetical protein
MPTNRKRVSRTWGAGADGLSEAAYQFFSMGDFFEGAEWATGKTEGELESFWKAHRQGIMGRFMEDLRRKGLGWEGNRPSCYWREIKEKRRKTGTREYFRPYPDREKHAAGVYETDYEFLSRLGLLEAWEIAACKGIKGGKKK